MFQSYEVTTNPEHGPIRLKALQSAMADAGVDGFLVPRADAHQGENVAPCDERLAWLTGFTGSAGFCVATTQTAALFVDSRYTLQSAAQVATGHFEIKNIPDDKLGDWVRAQLTEGQVLAFDPWLHSKGEIERLEKALEKTGIVLRPNDNLVDAIWEGRPPPPQGKITPHPLEFAGKSHSEKRSEIAEFLDKEDLGAFVLTLPDSIAWLLNIRGSDIERTPVPLAFAVLERSGEVQLFTDPAKLDDIVLEHLGSDVRVSDRAEFVPYLQGLEGRVGIDKASAPIAVSTPLKAEVVWQRDPCILPKALKNEVELAGARSAQLRDAAAMVEFLAWLDAQAPKGQLSEIDVAKKLEGFRSATNLLRDISFETISGAGPNGAIVHYRVNTDTNRGVKPGDLLLVDSGGQYLDGTTDITRTISVGTPPEGSVRAFTAVLKGMIGISMTRFPEGLAGRDIDAFARAALWQAGLDYDHGTGHGVGAFLGVHEGPAGISKRSVEPLKPGMILSNEPGYYEEGAYGIRIENLVVVTPPSVPEGGVREMLGFETLTYVPIDRRMIDADALTTSERDWLNAYHAETALRLKDLVSPLAVTWLTAATAPL